MKKNIFILMLIAFLLVFSANLFAEPVKQKNQTVSQEVNKQEEEQAASQEVNKQQVRSMKAIAALVSAALAFGFGALGAGAAIGRVGSAAMGAIAEKPSIAGQALIFVALAEGIVMFGFITALMILGKI